jgi:mannitol-1-/sugar-/sorbitol-6-phosphatase
VRTFDCAAILFDLDGVLVDSTASVGRVWKRWAEQQGLDADTVIRAAHGRRTVETIRLCAPHINAESALKLVEQMEIDDTPDLAVVNGARELLAAIPDDRWAVVTSGTKALATSRLKAAGLPAPAVLVTGDDVGNGKPHPEPYLKGAELLGFEAASCVVFEDTPPGIESGHAAGMRVVALTTTYLREKLRTADLIVPSLAAVQLATSDHGLTLWARLVGTAEEF